MFSVFGTAYVPFLGIAFLIHSPLILLRLFAVPALVVEELPIFKSLGRSWDLTDYHKTPIFGVAAGVTCYDLRVFKEGMDEDELAAVFD